MSQPSTDTDPPPKATLICPDCDHTSAPDGDWQHQRRLTKTVYRCPDCGTAVVSRPAERHGLALTPLGLVPGIVTTLWQGYFRVLARFLKW